jgi:hypothetical protein
MQVDQEQELQVSKHQSNTLLTFLSEQGKHRCIPPIILTFYFESLLYNKTWLCIKFIGIILVL